MAEKPYKQREEESLQVGDPVVEYSASYSASKAYVIPENELSSVMAAKEQIARGEYYTEDEMEKRIAEWLG